MTPTQVEFFNVLLSQGDALLVQWKFLLFWIKLFLKNLPVELFWKSAHTCRSCTNQTPCFFTHDVVGLYSVVVLLFQIVAVYSGYLPSLIFQIRSLNHRNRRLKDRLKQCRCVDWTRHSRVKSCPCNVMVCRWLVAGGRASISRVSLDKRSVVCDLVCLSILHVTHSRSLRGKPAQCANWQWQ